MGYQPIPGGGGYGTGSFEGIIQGMLEGHALGLQMQQEKRAQQEFLTQQAMHNQQMSMQDIMNQRTMQQIGRPVSAMGTVDAPSISAQMTAPSGTVSAPMSNAAPTPTPYGDAPTLSPAQLPAAMPGTGDQQISMPGYTRKADPSRVATYKTLGGVTLRSEIPTEEEQRQRDLADKTSAYRAQKEAEIQAQIAGMGPLAEAGARTDMQAQALVRKLRLAGQNGGIPAPPEFAQLGRRPGEPLLQEEFYADQEKLNKMGQEGLNIRKTGIEVEEAQRKLDLLKNANPQDYLKLVDDVVPLQGNAALNMRTKAQVSAALRQGDLAGAKDAIKQASSEVRQLEVATDPRVAQNKINISLATAAGKAAQDADAAGLTPDDYARSGEQYGRTGIMPSMGRDKVTRAKIEHAKNEWARENGFSPKDLVIIQAGYKGDLDSLKKLQAARDQTVSFEQTAQKNLDLFLDAASKIPDTGSPWLNKPLRSLNANLIGSANMAAVNAARQVANNEIAKVTSSGGMSGVLSDSARHEVDRYNPAEATFAQTVAVARILKQDMANRHQSYDQTLGDIKSRIGGGGATVQGGPPARGVVGAIGGTGQQGGAQTANPNPSGYIPGHVYGGLTYLGGDPNNRASWK